LDLPFPLLLLEEEVGIVTSGRHPEACRDLRRVIGGATGDVADGDDRAEAL